MPQTPADRNSAAKKAALTRKRRLAGKRAAETKRLQLASKNDDRTAKRESGSGANGQGRPTEGDRSAALERDPAQRPPARINVISIQQPWAWAIMNLGKVENRTWATKVRGPVLIHAGKAVTRKEFQRRAREIWETFGKRVPEREELDFGGIVGRANLVDCVWMPENLQPGARGFKRGHAPGSYGFIFEDCETLQFRALPGKLTFFEIPDE